MRNIDLFLKHETSSDANDTEEDPEPAKVNKLLIERNLL